MLHMEKYGVQQLRAGLFYLGLFLEKLSLCKSNSLISTVEW